MLAGDVVGGDFDNVSSELENETQTTEMRQPIVLLPGILGSLPRSKFESWLTFGDEAVHPDNLQVDPIMRTYDDLIASLVAAGYNDGSKPGMQTLWAAPYDWRLPVAPRDGSIDGQVETNGLDPTDASWAYGIEYLHHWIEQAEEEWVSWNGDPALFSVDIVAHSMGGLIARSYLQSDWYSTGQIDQLLMLGTPNHGAVDAYQVREWINGLLEVVPDIDLSQITSKLADLDPQHMLFGSILSAGAQLMNAPSVEAYSPSIIDLLPTFDFISTVWPHKWLQSLNDNTLVADLNHAYDYAGSDVEVQVLLGSGLETNYEIYRPLGIGLLGLLAYDDLPAGSGDTRVLASSAQLPGVDSRILDSVDHYELAGADVRAQQQVFEYLGIDAPADGYISGLHRSIAEGLLAWIDPQNSIIFADFDPIEFIQQHWPDMEWLAEIVGRSDHYAAFENRLLSIDKTDGVLANDDGVSGRSVTIRLEQAPLHGKLTISDDGSFVYEPDQGFNRQDSFRYRIMEGDKISELVTATITVATEFPWFNGVERHDVTGDGRTSPADALSVITTLNIDGGRWLPVERARPLKDSFYDVNRDGRVSPIDALMVISHLNSRRESSAEGEGDPAALQSQVFIPAPHHETTVAREEFFAEDAISSAVEREDPSDLPAASVEFLTTGLPNEQNAAHQRSWEQHLSRWDHSKLDEILTIIVKDLVR